MTLSGEGRPSPVAPCEECGYSLEGLGAVNDYVWCPECGHVCRLVARPVQDQLFIHVVGIILLGVLVGVVMTFLTPPVWVMVIAGVAGAVCVAVDVAWIVRRLR